MRLERMKNCKFKCSICSANFTNKKSMLAHERNFHSRIEVYDFCKVCGKQVEKNLKPGYVHDMRTHMRKCHPDVPETVSYRTNSSIYISQIVIEIRLCRYLCFYFFFILEFLYEFFDHTCWNSMPETFHASSITIN